ncbi:MAG: hypothetical protein JXB26_17865 [Candidatus Aminicenantes bacterium]|nr:hypothetical protein [Candidatus Aminicenantes bacterium]
MELYGRMVLALNQGILCDEIQDTMGKEHKLSLFDYNGNLIKSKSLMSGEGPDEITVLTLENVWISSNGKIMCEDNNYLKTLDPETFEIRTLKKFSNTIEGYGSKYIMGRHTYTSFEEKGNRTVTTVESTGYFENLTYYIAAYENILNHFLIISKFKKPKPILWAKIREGKRESYSDYYHFLRMFRIFSVDWKRDVVYTIPDIEKPEIFFVNLKTKREGKLLIDLDAGSFKIDKEELALKHEYVLGETSPELKSYFKHILYVPPLAPALMGIKVMEDRLIIITGKRDWEKQENEALVYRLPQMAFEGSFSIPYPNLLRTKWYDDIYIIEKLIKKNDDYSYYWEIYRINIS